LLTKSLAGEEIDVDLENLEANLRRVDPLDLNLASAISSEMASLRSLEDNLSAQYNAEFTELQHLIMSEFNVRGDGHGVANDIYRQAKSIREDIISALALHRECELREARLRELQGGEDQVMG
jgi:hypothetical protein